MRRNTDKEDWDAMKEEYYDRNCNSYTEGPGAHLKSAHQPRLSRRPVALMPPCKLYVHNIQSSITEAALRNIFGKFGMVVSFYRREGHSWALVEYQNISEGQAAISRLNGRKPLGLSVQFAFTDEEKKRRRKDAEEKQNFIRNSASNQSSYISPTVKPTYHREETYRPLEKTRYSDYDGKGFYLGKCSLCHYPSTLTCGVCGTWYCSPACQEEDWPNHKAICDCFRKALKLDYDSGKAEGKSQVQARPSNDSESERREAGARSRRAKSHGDRLGTSEPVKTEVDWYAIYERPEGGRSKWEGGHRGSRGGRNPFSVSGEQQTNTRGCEKSSQSPHSDSRGRGFDRAKREVDDDEFGGSNVKSREEGERREHSGHGESGQGREYGKGGEYGRSGEFGKGGKYGSGGRGGERRCYGNRGGGEGRGRGRSGGDSGEGGRENVRMDGEDSRPRGRGAEDRGRGGRGVMGSHGGGQYQGSVGQQHGGWQRSQGGVGERDGQRQDRWKDKEPTAQQAKQVEDNEEEWGSSKPEPAPSSKKTPGNEKKNQLSNIAKSYSREPVEVPAAEFKTATESTPDRCEEHVDLPLGKFMETRNGTLVEPKEDRKNSKWSPVNLEPSAERTDERNELENKGIKLPPSIIDLLHEGEYAVCEVQDVIKEEGRSYVVVAVVFEEARKHLESVVRHLPSECENMKKDYNFKPSAGDLVVVNAEFTGWKRAIVLGNEPNGWKLMLCDEGIVTTEKEVHRMPQIFQKIPCISAECHVVKSFVQKDKLSSEIMMVGSRLKLISDSKSTKNGSPELMCTAMNEASEMICSVKLLPWKPGMQASTPSSSKTEEKSVSSPENVVLQNGATVKIINFSKLAAIYVQACDRKSEEEVNKLLQAVAEVCLPVGGRKSLQRIPAKGSLVGCKFETDGNYYRALVVDVKSPDEISVLYIDFGNTDVVKLDLMCELPDHLKKVPAHAVRISLKDSFGDRLNESAVAYLADLVNKNEELKLVCPDGNLKSCDLLLKNGSSINGKLKEKLGASWNTPPGKPKNPLAVETVFKISYLKYDALPEPSGEEDYKTVQVVALSTLGNSSVVVCRKGHEHFSVVYDELQTKISEYCEELPVGPYVSRTNEMCFAKFSANGQWYRALSVYPQTEGSTVYFVDFGNVEFVQYADIRKMIQGFMEFPLLAIICGYKGLPEDVIDEKVDGRLKELIQPMREYTARVWKREYNEESDVDFPEVTEKLIEEGLLDAALFRH